MNKLHLTVEQPGKNVLTFSPDNDSALAMLAADHINDLEMHSFLNLFNVIYSQLELFVREEAHQPELKEAKDLTKTLVSEAKNGNSDIFVPGHISDYKNSVRRALHSVAKNNRDENIHSDVKEAQSLMEYVFSVLDDRLEELLERIRQPDAWHRFTTEEIRDDLQSFLTAMEKNSKGRFRFVRNIACKGDNDYLLHLEVGSDNGNSIEMPLLFKDVIRDLVANARKYTRPGGYLQIGICQREKTLRFVVADNGIGIPADELPLVFQYGYRASNAGKIRTMGGGFGLTKALHVINKFNGHLWIESQINSGTKITIELPLPGSDQV